MLTHEQILEYYKKCHPNEEDYSRFERLNTEKLFKLTFGMKLEDYKKRNKKFKKKLRKNKLNRENITQKNIKQVYGKYDASYKNRWKSIVTKTEKILILINVYYKKTEDDSMWYLNHGDVMKVRHHENNSNRSSILEIMFLRDFYAYRMDYIQVKDISNNFNETFNETLEEMVRDRYTRLTPDLAKALK